MPSDAPAQAFVHELQAALEAALARIGEKSAEGEAPAALTVPLLLRLALKNELEAAEEAALWVVGERDLEVKLGLMRQCGDEARHYRLIESRLRDLGDSLEGFDPLAGGPSPMFNFLGELSTTVERVAAGPFAREGLARVRNEVFIDFCEAQGDETTARLYREVIQPDEAHHHALGRRLLGRLAVTDEARALARSAALRTLSLAEELQEIARLKLGLSRLPGC